MKKKAITNVRIIDPKNKVDQIGGILINELGQIEKVGTEITKENIGDIQIFNCQNKVAIPGLIDSRVFVGEPGYEYKENYRTLSEAALSGGVTSVITMPNTNPVIDNVSTLDFIKRRARDKSIIKIYPLASLTKNILGKEMCEFGLLKLRGAYGFTDGVQSVQNNRVMDHIFNYAKNKDALVLQFIQDNELSENGVINEGIVSTRLGLKGISEKAEQIILDRDLRLLSEYKSKYHASLISTKKSLSIIDYWKKQKLDFTTSVSINNLSLNENDIGEFRTFLKLSPPLRTEEDRLALIDGLNNSLIDIIVSDHKPEDEESKRLTFQQATSGASGIESLLSLALELYHNKSSELTTLIRSMTSNPAKLFDLNAGSFDKNCPADIAIIDLNKPWVLKRENMKSKSKNTAIENKKLQGKVEMTFLNGNLVFENK
ncbi:MAG: dihydroorotase [Candidatus Pelagibacter sp.]|nr:dihydroorotase [Candidatus Pelagibacter sp.]OUV97343.1 MAG: dihydroorotase [Candidatus Pelagibacter sp. TMED142]